MRSKVSSIFDLSPSEKLQLVEDLWDDFAAKPEDVPVHDWQKQELARRKVNLLRNPASGVPWEEVKRRVHLPRPRQMASAPSLIRMATPVRTNRQ
ncbi:MAG: addiction module protein [Acidobacteriia bacterium]|nr:addiction module protein [Terriglobia bacterium]